VLALFFAFGLPAILQNVLENQIQKNLHRTATVESVIFNPLHPVPELTGPDHPGTGQQRSILFL
jgi:hypothetical protein